MACKTPQVQDKTSKKRNRTLLSCTECHRRKQRCNRSYPCNYCLDRGVPHKCHFVSPSGQRIFDNEYKSAKDARDRRITTGEEILLSFESVEDLQGHKIAYASTRASIGATSMLIPTYPNFDTPELQALFAPTLTSGVGGGFDPFLILPDTTGDPIPKSILIEYFIKRLGPWLGSYDDAQLSDRPAFSWLPYALHHPALFYATLLGAAVHLDRRQPMHKRDLVWYKLKTMRLANQTMNTPTEAATDQMLLVVLILLYFNVGGADGEEYEVHLLGINQMLLIRGGMGNLGMRGMIRNWLKICYGPWSHDWHYGLFADFHGIKRLLHE